MAGKEKIAKEMTISEVLSKYPGTLSIFAKYNLPCFNCPVAQAETIEQASKLHSINLEKFIKDLNKAIKKTAPD